MCFPQWRFSVNSTPRYFSLAALKGLVVEGVADGDLVSFLGHSELSTFL